MKAIIIATNEIGFFHFVGTKNTTGGLVKIWASDLNNKEYSEYELLFCN